MNVRSRFCLMTSALTLGLIGAAGAASAQDPPVPAPVPVPVTTVQTVTTTTVMYKGTAPLRYKELADILETKLIAKAGSHEAMWIYQGLRGRIDRNDVRRTKDKLMRVWE